MKSTETLSGVFDLGRDNIQDVYDISESPMPIKLNLKTSLKMFGYLTLSGFKAVLF